MPRLYLLTDSNDYNQGRRYWFPGASHSTSGTGRLFGPGWILCYRNPVVATFLAPIHNPYEHPHLWRCEGDIGISEHGLVIGSRRLTAVKRARLPELSADQRIHLAIMASRKVYHEASYMELTDRWLDQRDRRDGGDASVGAEDIEPRPAKVLSANTRDWVESAKESAFYTSAAMVSSPQANSLVAGLCANAVRHAATVSRIDIIGLASLVFESP